MKRLVVAILVAGAAVAAPAQAAWTAPDVLSRTDRSIENLRFAGGGDGRLLLSWQFFDRTRAGGAVASRAPGGRWGAQRTIGLTTVIGGRRTVTGAGAGLSSLAGFGRNGVVALATRGVAPRSGLVWWRGTTSGVLRRGGTLPEAPWYPGEVAAFADGAALAAWTTMRPRRGAGSNLRPRVAVVATRRSATAPFAAPRRISPLPPAPPYGNGLGPKLSATSFAIATGATRMVLAAWQRNRSVEARMSRDRGRTWGPCAGSGPPSSTRASDSRSPRTARASSSGRRARRPARVTRS